MGKWGSSVMRTVLINLLVLAALLAALEVAARVYITWTRGSQAVGLPQRTQYLSYRPFVMYGPDWDHALSPARLPHRAGVCRVLLVGGSTAILFPAKVLEQSLAASFEGRPFEVINAALGGYAARQEVIVASFWGPALQPDVLLSLDGANDLEHRLRVKRAGEFYLSPTYELYLTRPVLAPFAHLLTQSQLYSGIVRLVERRRIGPADEYADAIPVYIQAQQSLNVLARGMGAKRVMVLQPFSAFKTPLSPEEAAFTLYRYREDVVKTLYSRTHERLVALAARDDVIYVDGRLVFAGSPERIFTDDVHLTPLGYRRLADAIAAAMAARQRTKADLCLPSATSGKPA